MTSIRNTQEAILDAARASILDFGVRRTTLTTIAKYAGVSRPTLYRHYPDLEAIISDLITREILDLLPDEHDTGAMARQLIDLLVDTAAKAREDALLRRIIDVDPELFAPYVFERLGSSQATIIATLRAMIAAGHADGTIRPGDPDAMAAMLLLVVQSSVQSARIVRDYLDPAALDAELRRILIGYLEA